jgi:hypothetical protein
MLDGSLFLDPETLKMVLRKGDTGHVCLRLSTSLADGTFWFVVKEDASQPDSEAPIVQKYDHPGGSLLLITISEEESDKLVGQSEYSTCVCKKNYKDYIWALKFAEHLRDDDGNIIGVGSVKTLIPCVTHKAPIFRVYPEIIEGPNT